MLKPQDEGMEGSYIEEELDMGEEMKSVTGHSRGVRSHRYTYIIACSLRDARLTVQL